MILHGDPGDLGMLFASALADRASTGSELQAGLLSEIRDQVLTVLRDLYGRHAGANYNQLRDQFNEAATAFCAARIGLIPTRTPTP